MEPGTRSRVPAADTVGPDDAGADPELDLPDRTPRPLPPGTLIAGRYELAASLGHGGYAVVYRAHDRELHQEVALKLLRPERLDPSSLRRLRREVAVARDAVSPHLVRIFDVGTADGHAFVTMELVGGGTLRDWLAAGPLAIDDAVAVTAAVLSGLATLHHLGIVHRDVKPANVLVARDAPAAAKLADFGLALRLDRDETRATRHQSLVGTVDYLAPEQILGEDATPRSDLYAVGILLFEALTGRLPLAGLSDFGTLLQHLQTPPPDPRQLRPEVPPWLAAVVMRLLEKSPEDRYADADAILADLAAARPAEPAPRIRRRTRQLRLAAAVVLTLVAAGALTAHALSRRRFSHLRVTGSREIQAVDRRGEVLWRRETPVLGPAPFAVATLRQGEDPRVLLLDPPGTATSAKDGAIIVLDPATGRELRRRSFPQDDPAKPWVGGYTDRYGRLLFVADLDHDGVDEVLISHQHDPYWPSFVILWEPRLDRMRCIFVAAGHHRVVGAADLDGDGRDEILLLGINNRMGWLSGLAAVTPRPAVSSDESISAYTVAISPGFEGWSDNPPLWYALGPRPAAPLDTTIGIDRERGTLTYRTAVGRRTVDFAGFEPTVAAPRSSTVGLPPTASTAERFAASAGRQHARNDAHVALGAYRRALSTGDLDQAAAQLAIAQRNDDTAGDAVLSEWIERRRADLLVRQGQAEAAERIWDQALAASSDPAEIAYEAATTLQLHDDAERAYHWYRRGLARSTAITAGRTMVDFLEGLVLAAAASGRAREALDVLAAARAGLTEAPTQPYERFLRWRLGERLGLAETEPVDHDPSTPDTLRYWALELAHAAGHPAAALLPRVDVELARSSVTKPLLASLRAELLAARNQPGDREEAAQQARAAWEQAQVEESTSVAVRAHRDLVRERAERLVH